MGRMHEDDALRIAKELALTAHTGQTDKVGEAYIHHPQRVAAAAAHAGTAAEAVGWLHDVVEDSGITLDELRAAGLPEAVVTAVDALTRRGDEAADDYYQRVAANSLAHTVKVADLADNTDSNRLAQLPADVRARLLTKYAHAYDRLTVLRV